MREVGPDAARRRGAANRVTAAAVGDEDRGPGVDGVGAASTRARATRGTRPGVGEDVDAHVRVLEAAELGALAAIAAGLVGVEQDRFVCSGIMSIFRFSSGTQKLWITSSV